MKNIIILLALTFSLNSLAINCTSTDDQGCENVSSTREYTECMYKKLSSLTTSCKNIISIYKTCLNDIELHCPNVDSETSTFACLADNADKLSPLCKAAIN